MKLYVGGRGFGKTHKLIEWAKAVPAGERRVIIVASDEDRRRIQLRNPDIEAHSLPRFRTNARRSTDLRVRLGLDDLDRLLPWWFREHFGLDGVDVATATEWGVERLPTPAALHPNAVEVYVQLLLDCARCGQDHHGIEWRPLQRPIEAMTHWAPCPTNGEPILMRKETVPLMSPPADDDPGSTIKSGW